MKRGRKSSWDVQIEPRLDEIAAWCRDGLTDKQIASNLSVSVTTLFKYKAEKPELVQALKKNKEIADLEVENALFKKAIGYEYKEVIDEVFGTPTGEFYDDGKPKLTADRVRRRTITKVMPPDSTAQIFWLKNRQPEKWRDRKHTEHSGNVKVSHENWIDKLHEQD